MSSDAISTIVRFVKIINLKKKINGNENANKKVSLDSSCRNTPR